MKWRGYALLALPCGLALAGPPAPPDSTAPPASTAPTKTASAGKTPAADADLLEYLGSVDSDEPGWNEYLEHTNLEKVIHAPPKPATPTTPGKST